MGQLLQCHAEVLVPQKTKSTLKNLSISALGSRKWFYNYQREKLFTDVNDLYRVICSHTVLNPRKPPNNFLFQANTRLSD